jgi:hypothetical protein
MIDIAHSGDGGQLRGQSQRSDTMPAGISIHIGLNRVNPKHYRDEFGRPWDGALGACEFDARDMQALAQARGFQTSILLTEQA